MAGSGKAKRQFRQQPDFSVGADIFLHLSGICIKFMTAVQIILKNKMSINPGTHKAKPNWYSNISKYSQANLRKAIWQLFNTFLPYIALWVLMVYLVQSEYSYWIVLASAFLPLFF